MKNSIKLCTNTIDHFDQFRFKKHLASKKKCGDSFSHVGLFHRNGDPCVIKILHQPQRKRVSLMAASIIQKEIQHLKSLLTVSLTNSSFLQEHLELQNTNFAAILFFTMPYFGSITAREYTLTHIKNKNTLPVIRLIILVFQTITKLHNQAHIIHGDLSLNNIIIPDDQTAILIDAEHACKIGEQVDYCTPFEPNRCYWSQDRINSPTQILQKHKQQASSPTSTALGCFTSPAATPKHDFIAFLRFLFIDVMIKQDVKRIRPLFRVHDKILSNDANIQHCVDFNLLLQQLQRLTQPSAPSLPASPRLADKRSQPDRSPGSFNNPTKRFRLQASEAPREEVKIKVTL